MSNSSDSSSDPSSVDLGPDQRPLILTLGIVFGTLATGFTAARFHARRVKAVGFEADDWTCLVGLVFSISVCIIIMLDAMVGNLGWHTEFGNDGLPVDWDSYLFFGKARYAFEVLNWLAVGFTKISVLLLYKRVFGISHVLRVLVWLSIGVVIAWTLAFSLSVAFQCLPVASIWDPTVPGSCVNLQVLFTWSLATDVATDGLILLLPVYNVAKLQMPLSRKISIIGIFMLGGLVTITGVIRIHYLTLVYNDLLDPLFDDVTYAFAPTFYWTIIECTTGIMCACAPTLMPLVEKYHINTLGSRLLSSIGLSSNSGSTRLKTDSGGRPSIRSGKNPFWSNLFSNGSKRDTASSTSLTQLTEKHAPKMEN